MPVFDFKCTNKKCNYRFEIFHVLQKILKQVQDERKEKCPKCGSEAVKVPSKFSFKI